MKLLLSVLMFVQCTVLLVFPKFVFLYAFKYLLCKYPVLPHDITLIPIKFGNQLLTQSYYINLS